MPSTASLRAERSIEFLVWSNPDPHPEVPFKTLRHRAKVLCCPDRPETRVAPQALEMQTRVRRTACELSVGTTGRTFQFRRQCPIQTPEVVRAARLHSCLSNSSSVNSGNCSGFSRTRASISSPNAVNAGRGRGSRMIDSQRASPSNSGTKPGSDSASCARSSAERFLIAFAISSTVLTNKFYDKRPGFTRPQPVR
jgi:hypothetical protein